MLIWAIEGKLKKKNKGNFLPNLSHFLRFDIIFYIFFLPGEWERLYCNIILCNINPCYNKPVKKKYSDTFEKLQNKTYK